MIKVDLAILGAGPGGYVAAIRAAQLGMKVAIVEREKLGGVCLHKGCIPSKTFLRSAELYHTMKSSKEYGIHSGNLELSMPLLQKRKQGVISNLHKGIEHLLKKNKIDVYVGTGRILGPSIFSPIPGTVSVERCDGGESDMLVPQFVLIATGSSPKSIPGLEEDGHYILNSDHALNMEAIPASILIVGGGVIGVEWASMLSDFGAKVTLVEMAERILPGEDADISKEMTRILKKRKVDIITKAKVRTETVSTSQKNVALQVEYNNAVHILTAEKLLVSVGRKANIEDIGLHNTSIQIDKGAIRVNDFMQTKESHIYAIGDVIGGYQLAHVASHEGMLAVNHMVGNVVHPINPLSIPRCIYSRPEMASIGYSEKEARQAGFDVKVGKFSFRGSGKALVFGEVDGFIKLISDKNTDDLLGVHIIGPHATELISTGGLAKLLDATAWEVSNVIYPHPTLSEVYGEVSLAINGRAIHM